MSQPTTTQDLLAVARGRLVPSLTNPNYLVLRRRTQIIGDWIRRLPASGLSVLDIGGRYQPYRPLLESRVKSYIAVDILPTQFVDVIASGDRLPFRDGAFDLVIATGVFEYFPEPVVASRQIHRVLKPGGFLFMSVGAVAPRFVDEEHWRYMPAGLRSTLSPFSQVEVVPETYSLGGFCRMTNVGLNTFCKFDWIRRALAYTVFPAVNFAGLALEGMSFTTNDQFAGNYSAIARK